MYSPSVQKVPRQVMDISLCHVSKRTSDGSHWASPVVAHHQTPITLAMVSALPPEILRMIFADVDDRKTLCNILITSQQFSHLVERFLYARIVLTGMPLPKTIKRLASLNAILESSNGRRARYVQNLCFGPAQGEEDRSLINKIPTQTVNLKDLTLHIFPHMFPQSFSQVPQFALTSLHVTFHSLDPSLHHFLESQTSLETLYLGLAVRYAKDLPAFSPASFPNLKTLSIVSLRLHAFLPTLVRVTHLRVGGNYRDSGEIALCMGTVRVLSCPDTHTVTSMNLLLPNLEWLELLNPTSTTTLLAWCPHILKLRGVRLPRFYTPQFPPRHALFI